MNEKDLEQLKTELNQIEIPKERLAIARNQGYTKYKNKLIKKRKIILRVALAAIFLLAFVTTIRVSPAFAQTIAKIPGFAPLVSLITYDKGVKDIVDNNYYEELGIVQEKNNLKFTILGTIADESGMIIFYQLESTEDISELVTKSFRIKQNNKELPTTYSWSPKGKSKIIQNQLEVVSQDPLDYSNPNFELVITFSNEIETTFEVPFTLTKPIAESKYFELNQTVEIDGQKLLIESLKISPIRAHIKVKADPNNTMQILNIEYLSLVDENGEDWGKITSGVIGFGGFKDETNSIFIQSNYFREPEKLTLVIDKIEALPKGEDYIEIDFLKKEVLKNPIENEVTIQSIGDSSLDVTYPEGSRLQLYNVIDANGEEFHYYTHSMITGIINNNESSYYFDLNNAVNPVKIYISSYSNYLNGSAKVEIPMN
ncbi:DUF4179 domain-containing protein [Ureibacillus sp. MALMAid1270]|uniref:DUF4179 domain-containing protein n=1 Tax=Ureibacillus sp. MALMAid1270 TaxID=3411629 RepID=UPI003BA417E0